MTDFASLKFAIDTGDLKRASAELDKLTAKGKKTERATDQLDKGFKKATSSVSLMSVAMTALTVAMSAKKLINYADTMTLVNSRLKLATNSTMEFTKAQTELFNIAQESRQEYAATADLYSRMSRATKQLGIEQQELFTVTNAVNQALIVSGASAQEASSVITQLGQGLASGVLRGEEFNSIMENGSRVALALADSLEVGLGELRAMAKDGKLSSQIIIDALVDQADTIDNEFDRMETTVSQSLTVLENGFISFVDKANEATKATSFLARTLSAMGRGFSGFDLDDLFDFNTLSYNLHNNLRIPIEEATESLEDWNQAVKEFEKFDLEFDDFGDLSKFDKIGLKMFADFQKEKLRIATATNDAENEASQAIAQFNRDNYEAELEAREALAKYEEEQLEIKLKGQEDYNAHVTTFYEMRDELEARATDLITSDIDKINDKYLEMFDVIDGIWDVDKMETFFDKWDKELKKINKEQDKYEGIGSKDWTQGLTGISKDIGNIGKAFSDLSKDQKEYNKLSEEDKELKKDEYADSQARGYGNLAGVMSSFYEQGSSGAATLQAAQMALQMPSLIAGVMNQSSLPYPYNIIAMASTFGLGMSMMGGGGGGATSGMSVTEQNVQNIEDTYNPTIERLDRQIELLEAIDRNGSASALNVELAATTFEKEYSVFVEESLGKMFTTLNQDYGGAGSGAYIASTQTAVEKELGFNLVDVDISKWASTTVDKDSLREDYNFIKLIEGFYTGLLTGSSSDDWSAGAYEAMLDMGWAEAGRTPRQQYEANINAFISEYQDLVSDFTLSLLDSMEELKEAADDFKDAYDSVTDSTFYQTQRLEEAFSDVDRLKGEDSFSDYLKNEIENIEKLGEFLTDDRIELLLLEDPTKLEEQINLVQELEKETGITFENGAEDALNYLESIELVAEAMTTSRENIKDWNDSFKTSDELLIDLANGIGVDVATNLEELNALFDMLSGGVEGLNDAELELLETNKDYLESIGIITSAMMGIDVLSPTLDTLQQTIDKLRASSTDSTYSLDRYYESMAKTKDLLARDDYSGFAESLSETTGLSSALYDITAFDGVTNDMLFAQAVAANQFEAMQVDVLTEIDILKEQNVLIAEQNALITELLDVQNASLGELQSIEEAS